jgi:hypothetical protein
VPNGKKGVAYATEAACLRKLRIWLRLSCGRQRINPGQRRVKLGVDRYRHPLLLL